MFKNTEEASVWYASNRVAKIVVTHGVTSTGRCTCGKEHSDKKEIGKHPATANGLKEATSDIVLLSRIFARNADYNFGFFCEASGFTVFDVDPRNGGVESFEKLKELVGDEVFKDTVIATSGEYWDGNDFVAGFHIYFNVERGLKFLDPAKLGFRGIDIKYNGYIMAEPSFHISGVTYKFKEGMELWRREPKSLPDPLRKIFIDGEIPPSHERDILRSSQSHGASLETGQLFDRESFLSSPIYEGNRAVSLHQAACSLANLHGTDEKGAAKVMEIILNHNRTMVHPPLPEEGPDGIIRQVNNAIEFVRTNPSTFTIKALTNGALVGTTDAQLTDWLATILSGEYLWTSFHGWLHYDQGCWTEVSQESVVEVIRKKLLDLARESRDLNSEVIADAVKKLLGHSRIRAAEALLRGSLEMDPHFFDCERDLLNVENGVIDLASGELLRHEPRYLFTKQTRVPYYPNFSHRDWDSVMECLPAQEGEYLQKFLGQALTGYPCDADLAILAIGGGSNGKSLLFGSVEAAMGPFCTTLSERVLVASGDQHTTELTDLFGVRLALLEEFPDRSTLNINRLKLLVGTKHIRARKMRQDNFTFENVASIVITANHYPNLSGTGHSVWRRLVSVKFPFTFKVTPTKPEEKLLSSGLRDRMFRNDSDQLSAVMSWLVEGSKAWYSNGRRLPLPPKSIASETENWRTSQDLISKLMKETFVLEPGSHVLLSEVHALFKETHPEQAGLLDISKFAPALEESDWMKTNGLEVNRLRLANKKVSTKTPGGNQSVDQKKVISGIAFK